MSIVFGWNELKIKEFKPEELGIYDQNAPPDLTIEARQKYFHLFWIPFFGIGKRWVARRGGDMYKLSKEARDQIRASGVRVNSPWYTFSGLILIGLAVVGFSIHENLEQKRRREQSINYHNQKVEILKHNLAHLQPDAMLKLKPEQWYQSSFFKVEEITGDEVKCVRAVFPKNSHFNEDEYPVRAAHFFKENPKLPPVILKKSMLEMAFAQEYDPLRDFKGLDLLGSNDTLWMLEEVIFPFAPNLGWGSSSGYSRRGGVATTFNFSFTNHGEACELVGIQTLEGQAVWDTAIFPLKMKENGYTVLTGKNFIVDGNLKFRITARDEQGKNHVFEFWRNKTDRFVRKIFE